MMSKCLGDCIYLSDSEEELQKKVYMLETDNNRIKVPIKEL